MGSGVTKPESHVWIYIVMDVLKDMHGGCKGDITIAIKSTKFAGKDSAFSAVSIIVATVTLSTIHNGVFLVVHVVVEIRQEKHFESFVIFKGDFRYFLV